jgi:hypothetical protein
MGRITVSPTDYTTPYFHLSQNVAPHEFTIERNLRMANWDSYVPEEQKTGEDALRLAISPHDKKLKERSVATIELVFPPQTKLYAVQSYDRQETIRILEETVTNTFQQYSLRLAEDNVTKNADPKFAIVHVLATDEASPARFSISASVNGYNLSFQLPTQEPVSKESTRITQPLTAHVMVSELERVGRVKEYYFQHQYTIRDLQNLLPSVITFARQLAHAKS